jgi:addiction module RelE/StbE family toxin
MVERFEVEWTIEAKNWLREIFVYISQDSPRRAEAHVSRLIRSADRLKTFPLSGAVSTDDPRVRVLVVSGYRIAYRVKLNLVSIAAVLSPGLRIEDALNRRWD